MKHLFFGEIIKNPMFYNLKPHLVPAPLPYPDPPPRKNVWRWLKGLCQGMVLGCLVAGCSDTTVKPPASTPSCVRVVATLNPLYSLAQEIMRGRGTPELLLEAQSSCHTAFLKPSQKRLIHGADLVMWVGESFETFLAKEMGTLPAEKKLTLLTVPHMILHAQGNTPCCQGHGHAHSHTHSHSHTHTHSHSHTHTHSHDHEPHVEQAVADDGMDGHIWMDPRNGVQIARALAERLCALDPEGALIYKANLEALEHKLWALDQELMALLRPCRSKPFFVTHPAYTYLIKRYGLAHPQPLILNHDGLLTPKSLLALGEFLKMHPGGWVFFEPQFETACTKIVSLIHEKGGRIAHLDPLGIDRDYCDLLRACAKSIAACLSYSPETVRHCPKIPCTGTHTPARIRCPNNVFTL